MQMSTRSLSCFCVHKIFYRQTNCYFMQHWPEKAESENFLSELWISQYAQESQHLTTEWSVSYLTEFLMTVFLLLVFNIRMWQIKFNLLHGSEAPTPLPKCETVTLFGHFIKSSKWRQPSDHPGSKPKFITSSVSYDPWKAVLSLWKHIPAFSRHNEGLDLGSLEY